MEYKPVNKKLHSTAMLKDTGTGKVTSKKLPGTGKVTSNLSKRLELSSIKYCRDV